MFLKRLFYLKNPRYLREEYQSKAQLLNNTSLLTIGMCLLITAGCFIFNFRQGKIIMGFCTAAFVSIYYYFRKKGGGLVLCSNLYLGVTAVVILLSCYYSGAFNSPVLYWSIVLPMYAFWLLGTRYGFIWLGIALFLQLLVLTFGTLGIYAPRLFDFYAPENVGLLYVLVVLLIVNVAAFCYDFETGKFRALSRISGENIALQDALQKLEATRQELEKAQQHKDLFLSQMSHEMRTPMNAIVGLSNLLLENQDSRAGNGSDLEIINQSARNLLGIIDDILDITRIQSGKFSFNYTDFDTRQFVDALVKPLVLKAAEKKLPFNVHVSPALPPRINSDPVRLSQIINNLCGNAIKFTTKGHVSLTINYSGTFKGMPGFARLQIAVSDTGIGIPAKKIPVIFETFRQADDATHRKFGGTGLGLTITKQLAEHTGGSIKIVSREHKGTTAIVQIPVKQAETGESVPAALPSVVQQRLSAIRVLIADDYDVNRMVTIKTIRSELPGVVIDEAVNGQEAVDLVGRHSYDVVLMDVQMPVLDGLEATRWIRSSADKRIAATRIIGLTSYAMKDDEIQCRNAGMDDYLSKPFARQDLLMKMYRLVNSGN